eukprot:2401615-Rhodomonas_salina.1
MQRQRPTPASLLHRPLHLLPQRPDRLRELRRLPAHALQLLEHLFQRREQQRHAPFRPVCSLARASAHSHSRRRHAHRRQQCRAPPGRPGH